MVDYSRLPPNVILFGPDGNCTLDLCPIEASLYGYRPSMAASISFIALYALAACAHILLGVRWKKWFFMTCMVLGCLNATAGYVGRIIMYNNPFNFAGFMLQIVCITSGPVYFTAAIYVSLAQTIQHFTAPAVSRFSPRLYYCIFIPGDLICLVIQAAGGALSTSSKGANQTGVDLALAGLVLQVFFMLVFCALFADYLVRCARASRPAAGGPKFTRRLQLFFGSQAIATLLILVRCAYRLAELHEGYGGELVRDEALFIGLEGVMIVIAVYLLMVGHPGLVFNNGKNADGGVITPDSQLSGQKQ